ncbi:hypothetical protein B0T20DRAFT_399378 [Sordaria brevicollis]|uniref:Uncharacterized protein n=1 Tax=Sordaria brevicollis TaxID=83679 RepID=A0AAE0UG72_SORBR|nr:hypothetical protein B0T20DRAFT_399378 [Sordaria brevicollis]
MSPPNHSNLSSLQGCLLSFAFLHILFSSSASCLGYGIVSQLSFSFFFRDTPSNLFHATIPTSSPGLLPFVFRPARLTEDDILAFPKTSGVFKP